MSTTSTKPADNEPVVDLTEMMAEFLSSDFDTRDEADMAVMINGKPTGWIWTFAGPGHAQAVAQADRMQRERSRIDREKETARVNGRRWKAEVESPEETRASSIRWIVERLVRWSLAKIDGEVLPFSAEAATKLLSDPRKGDLFAQAVNFLGDADSFKSRSAKA